MRTFATGATRDSDEGKHDYDGYLSPRVIERFGEYMTENQVQPDGTTREGDNWQKGMGLRVYMKSGWRHFFHWWKLHRRMLALAREYQDVEPSDEEMVLEVGAEHLDQLEKDICALLFNAQGYLHELLLLREEG